jgi:hypothetical protein
MVYINSRGKPVACDASIADLIDNIHKALQTATMIDMAKTTARKFWIVVITALAALLSSLAAWTAVLKN